MICNKCNRSLKCNEYKTHWKSCVKSNGKRVRGLLRMKPEHLEARRIKKQNKLNGTLIKKPITRCLNGKGALKREIKRLNAIIEKKDSKVTVNERKYHPIYDSVQWKELRYKTLRKHGFKCLACKSTNTELHIDHIKPVSKYPELTFNEDNLQVLCRDCNLSKSNKYEDDLR